MIEPKKMEGKNKGDILLYALSTCIWCRKTKKLLEELQVEYRWIDVDLIENIEDKTAVQREIVKWNPDASYPTMVINNKECVKGFDEDRIREVCK